MKKLQGSRNSQEFFAVNLSWTCSQFLGETTKEKLPASSSSSGAAATTASPTPPNLSWGLYTPGQLPLNDSFQGVVFKDQTLL